MKSKKPSKGVFCPMCGQPAKLLPCFVCSPPPPTRRLVSKAQCPYCKGTGTRIYCESCEKQRRQLQAAQASELDALKKNPFLPYYDKRFRKYRK